MESPTAIAVKMATLATAALDRPQDAIDVWLGVLATRRDDGGIALDYKPVKMGPYVPMERKY